MEKKTTEMSTKWKKEDRKISKREISDCKNVWKEKKSDCKNVCKRKKDCKNLKVYKCEKKILFSVEC